MFLPRTLSSVPDGQWYWYAPRLPRITVVGGELRRLGVRFKPFGLQPQMIDFEQRFFSGSEDGRADMVAFIAGIAAMVVYITHADIKPVVRSIDIERSYAGIDSILAALTDPRNEPGAGAPASSISFLAKLDYLFKWARNKKDADGTTNRFYADDASTVDHSQGTSEAAGLVTVGEMGGP